MPPPPTRLRRTLLLFLVCAAVGANCGRIVGEGATALNVVGSLGPIHDALLTFDPRMRSVILPLSSPSYVVSPPRLYVADPEVIRKLSVPTSPSTPQRPDSSFAAPPAATNTNSGPYPNPYPFPNPSVTRPSVISVANPNFGNRRANSPAASEANFPSSQGRNFSPRDDSDDFNAGDTVRQIQAYSKPVTIPASGRAHFSTLNADGSYHFGYDTGSGQHQSYREEKRFPDGRIEGKYGYVDPDGVLRVVEYVADRRGYRSRLTTHNLSSSSPPSFIGPIPSPLLARARSAASAGR